MLTVRIGTASRPRPGEVVCGDQAGFWTDGVCTTIILADGLGHGPEAELAAKKAVEVAGSAPSCRGLEDVLNDVHANLAGTRGAAVTLVRVDAGTSQLEHVAVGNVEMVALTTDAVRPITSAGVVGMRMRRPMVSTHRLHASDLLVLFTDGLTGRFALDRFRGEEPQSIADALLVAHSREHDDASCVVVRV